MAQPKKRLSPTRSGNRRSHLALTPPARAVCSHCQAPILSHAVCRLCGYYQGKLVLPPHVKEKSKTAT